MSKPLTTVRKFLFVTALTLISFGSEPAKSGPLTDFAGSGDFTLQVGTYSSRSSAAAVIQNLPDAWLQEITSAGRKAYRVNYKRFSDRNQALRAQWDLEDRGYKSFVQRLYT